MKKKLTIILFLIFILGCFKDYNKDNESNNNKPKRTAFTTNEYYLKANGKEGIYLKSALNEIITENHNKLTYKKAYNALEYTDEDPNNSDNIILFYTGRSHSKKLRSQFDPKNGWNREHVWPKSKGFKTSSANYAYTDLHHLRPTDASVNSSRGNKDFDDGGIEHTEAIANYVDDDSWEPRDEVKGDVARMMFYMAVRYEGLGNKYDDYDLELVDYTNTESNSKIDFDGKLGKLSTLLEWHKLDPVDEWEKTRHEKVYELQGNRNPFIDNPDWVDYIW